MKKIKLDGSKLPSNLSDCFETYDWNIPTWEPFKVVPPNDFSKITTSSTTTVNTNNFTYTNSEPEVIKYVTKGYDVKVKGLERKITVGVVLYDNGIVGAGISVLHPDDFERPDMSERIAIGRATNPKSNLLNKDDKTYRLGTGFAHTYILYAIADNVIRDIKREKINIKGIRK